MKKRALLIGINEYEHYGEFPLDGCVNDIEIMAAVLKEKFGFNDKEIILVTDKDATRDRIVGEMRDILENCEPDALIVLHFSGHGTRRVSKESTRPDGLEETIIPYDSGPDNALNRDIRDSDLRDWFAHLTQKTRNICFFCDSCYSGSIVRGEKIRGIETDSADAFSTVEKSEQQNDSESLFPRSSANWLSLSANYVLLASCKKDEFAREYTLTEGNKRTAYGAFTYFLVRELRNASEDATYQDVFEQLCLKMQLKYASQHPQIEGQNRRRLFTGTESESLNYVLVKERVEDEVILLAGAAHGITLNSEWGISVSGAKNTSADKIGTVKISEIDAVTSKAKIIEENDSLKIEAGNRAVEEVHCYKNKKIKVFFDVSLAKSKQIKQTIAETVKKSSWLAVTNQEVQSEFIVALAESESKNDGQKEVQIVIMQSRDYQVLWSISKSDKNYHQKICRILETLVRFSMVSELENPSSKIKGLVEFNLLQKKGNEWGEANTVYNELPLYYEGEQIGFRIINKSSVPIYISVLDLGLTKSVGLLYPRKAAAEKLEKSRSAAGEIENPNLGRVKIGVLPNERITLYIPDESLLTDLPDINLVGGVEIFKLMVTTEQTNFSWIEQDGLRLNLKSKSPLEELMYLFWSENHTREGKFELDEENDWFTINRGFYLCKK